MKTKHIVFIAVIGALYTVLTLGLAPISYGPIQFRVSEVLKVFALFNPWTGVGIAVGDIFSSLNSPFVGPWELVFMPITDAAGGFLAYWIFRLMKSRAGRELGMVLSMIVYSLTTAASVAAMLFAFGVDLFTPLFLSISLSELVILTGGIWFVPPIVRLLNARGSRFFDEV